MNRKFRIISTIIVIVVGSLLLWRSAEARRAREEQVSDHPLSLALGERWGGGLPAGFTAPEIADDLETAGRLFARITYKTPVDALLEQWTAADAAAAAAFDAMIEAHLAADIPSAHRTLLEAARPVPDGTWLTFTAEAEGAALRLLYDPAGMVLYVAEYQPNS